MAVSPLGVLVGIILIFLAPGYFLLQAIFPGRRYFGPFHVAALVGLSMALSVAITVVVGTILGFRGAFYGAQTGPPILELSLGGISLALFGVAWWRGAFPLLGREAEYEPHAERGEPEEVTMLRDLRLEEERLRKESRRVRRRANQSRDPGVKLALSEAAEELERERKVVSARAKDLERKAGERRYAGKGQGTRWPTLGGDKRAP